MKFNRRDFIKAAGLGVAGMAASPIIKLLEASDAPRKLSGSARLAMAVDLVKCGEYGACDLCIRACHEGHNVPKIADEQEKIEWVWKENFERAFHDQSSEQLPERLRSGPALLLCNHCDSPPCVNVCPTGSTWKRSSDGIVMMDWHRCIGCRYCMAACPYGSRSFNWRDPRAFLDELRLEYPTRAKGVVEKCTFCEELIGRGQLPMCVSACPAGALAFGDLHDGDSPVRRALSGRFSIRRKPGLGTQPQVFYLV